MKRLFLDLGNSRFKWAEEGLSRIEARVYPDVRPEAGMLEAIGPALENVRLVIASVRGDAFNRRLADALTTQGVNFGFLRTPELPGFRPAYRRPADFGVDRALNLIGAARDYPLPVLVVSAGTAVTFDLMDAGGRHLGGCIFPGLGLLRRSLLTGAEAIGAVAGEGELLAEGTAAGAAGGTRAGFLAAVQGIAGEMVAKTAGNVTILLTGGDAALIHEHLALPSRVDSLLLFKGMDIVSQRSA